jgi:hypothetical protein
MSRPRCQLLDLCPHCELLSCDPSSCHRSFYFLSLANSHRVLSRACLLPAGIACHPVFISPGPLSRLDLPSHRKIMEIFQLYCIQTWSVTPFLLLSPPSSPPPHLSVGLTILLVWCVILPFSVGFFYHMLLNYPHDNPNNYLVTLTPSVLLRIFLFGALLVSQLVMTILSGQVDSLLLSMGTLPIFENHVFAIGTVWNSLQPIHVPPNGGSDSNDSSSSRDPGSSTSQKLANDLLTLEVLTIRPVIRYCCYSLLITFLLLFSQEFCYSTSSSSFFSLIFSYSWGHLFVYLLFLVMVAKDLSGPLRRWARWYYSTIKDENYLIGMELQNSDAVSVPAAPPHLDGVNPPLSSHSHVGGRE